VPNFLTGSAAGNTIVNKVSNTAAIGNLKYGIGGGTYIAIACIGGVLLSGTKIGPIIVGINGVALIYQLNVLISKRK